jgi:uncharacterized protein
MRHSHCTVALALVLLFGAVGASQTKPAAQPSEFTLFFRGLPVGTEEVTVASSPEGILISGTARSGAPLNIVTRVAEVRYTPDWRPLECRVEGSVNSLQVVVSTKITGTTASTLYTEGTAQNERTLQIPADAVVMPNMLFTAAEALSARLVRAKPGDQLQVFVPPQSEMTVTVKSATDDRVRTQDTLLTIRRFALQLSTGKQTTDAELWAHTSGRLLRFALPAQGLDVVRRDVASVTSRREPVARPNDEVVHIPGNGFNLAGTLSKPAPSQALSSRLPAVVLVTGSSPNDREETVAGIPIMGQLSSALADAGYIVVRYDKRGIGQSGGRQESVTVEDYAEDVVAVVKFLERRKDVAPKRIAVVGYGEGGSVALAAAAREGRIAAVALAATPGVGGAEMVLDQQRRLLDKMNVSENERQTKLQLQQAIQQAVISGIWPDSIPQEMRRQADTTWYRSYLLFDPEKTVKKTKAPILVVHGQLDQEVLPANADRLGALAAARKGKAGSNVKVVRVPGMNHLLVPSKTGEADEYASLGDAKISADLVAAITSWLGETLGTR